MWKKQIKRVIFSPIFFIGWTNQDGHRFLFYYFNFISRVLNITYPSRKPNHTCWKSYPYNNVRICGVFWIIKYFLFYSTGWICWRVYSVALGRYINIFELSFFLLIWLYLDYGLPACWWWQGTPKGSKFAALLPFHLALWSWTISLRFCPPPLLHGVCFCPWW